MHSGFDSGRPGKFDWHLAAKQKYEERHKRYTKIAKMPGHSSFCDSLRCCKMEAARLQFPGYNLCKNVWHTELRLAYGSLPGSLHGLSCGHFQIFQSNCPKCLPLDDTHKVHGRSEHRHQGTSTCLCFCGMFTGFFSFCFLSLSHSQRKGLVEGV